MKLVIKLSGKVLESATLIESLARQVRALLEQDTQLILVHGGGKQLTRYCRRAGIRSVVHHGRRVTDTDTLEAARMVFGSINQSLTAALTAHGINAVGLSAFDGYLTRSRRRPPIQAAPGEEPVDFGFVAEIEAVDTSVIELLWRGGCVPVISCLCADPAGQLLNINADTLSAHLALALNVDRLISVSDVEGIYLDPADPDTLVPSIGLERARSLLEEGVFSDGMIPKVQNAIQVIEQGLPSFQILSGVRENGVLEGVFGEAGTLLRAR